MLNKAEKICIKYLGTIIIMAKSNVNVSMSIHVSISSRLGRSSNNARIEIAAVAISMEIT